MDVEDSDVAVLLEDIRSQMRIFGEGIQMLDEKFSSRFQEMDARFDRMDARFDRMDVRFNKMDARFDRMESHLTSFERQNQQEHQLMMQMIKELNEERLERKQNNPSN